jgi:hypothetical protein
VPKYEEDMREIFKLYTNQDNTPQYLANNYQDTFEDLLKCDFPAYYTRLSEKWILNSKGYRLMKQGQSWQLPKSKFDIVLEQIKSFKNQETFIKCVCSGLRQISQECRDLQKERGVTFKTLRFEKKQDTSEWSGKSLK